MTAKPQLIAAHHIALLLLSTAEPGSADHHDIIELNGHGVWHALEELDLVASDGQSSLWHLTPRGEVYVAALLALPLPEWRVPTVPGASTPAPSPKSRMARVLKRAALASDARPESLEVDPKLQSPSADSDEEGEPPPRAPNPKPIPGILPAADPGQRLKQAEQLLNQGFGLNEVAETLEMEANELERTYFK